MLEIADVYGNLKPAFQEYEEMLSLAPGSLNPEWWPWVGSDGKELTVRERHGDFNANLDETYRRLRGASPTPPSSGPQLVLRSLHLLRAAAAFASPPTQAPVADAPETKPHATPEAEQASQDDFSLQRAAGGRPFLRPEEATALADQLGRMGQEVEVRPIGAFTHTVWARPTQARPAKDQPASAAAVDTSESPGLPAGPPNIGQQGEALFRLTAAQLAALIDAAATSASRRRWRWWQRLLLVFCLVAFALIIWPTPFAYF
jgi:hypothetical protein